MSNAVPLPAGTVLGKSYEHGIDINLGTYASPSWQPVRRMSGWAPTFPKVTTDVTTYDDRGATNEEVTGRGFAADFTVQGNRSTTTGLYLPELEAIVAAARAKGEGAVLDIRFYHKPETGTPSPNDAGRAQVTVESSRQNTGNAETETFAISLAGKGEYEPIENPFQGWGATVPVVSYVSPPNAGDGDLITISGSGFLGATSVTIDGDEVEFTAVNGASVIAVVPVGEAGAVPVVVTTSAGASTAFTFTRGA
ncbi:IPT/TIG domain-containing protein [Microbacterium sp. KSW-18]|uniref:IPT/TIG domain-containing protein n=1 Tax=Microbacterium aquilitoris TaxID=3067307 RepID=A0ABU3GL24_9MICO|nr:IPT/TIG domain-containing protein [Microbacterium sp. KSW-18]MDT3331403.1 IPT/TIG domain-containing protein [Microbacterium sp. KSW-18]